MGQADMNKHVIEVGAIATGGLAAVGHFCELIQPILADVSYAAAIVVGIVTLIQKWRNRNK
jgi:hypothetical protein